MAIQVVSDGLLTAFWVCAPLLLLVFTLGIFINLMQVATSLQDQVFSTIPRLCACVVGVVFLMPWMLNHATNYTMAIMRDLPKYAR